LATSDVKYCQECGSKNPVDQKFCGKCGFSFDQPKIVTEKGPSAIEKGSGMGVISLVTAILGFTCLPGIGLIIAMITGYITPNAKENTFAKAGTSIAVFVLATALLVICIIGLASAGGFYWYIVLLLILGLVVSVSALVLQIRWLVKKPTT